EQRLQRVVVGVGEVDVRLALVGDRHGRGGDVALPGRESRARLQAVKAHRLHFDLEPDLLGDRGEQVDVKARVAAGARGVLELKGRVGDVRAHRERAGLDQVKL